LAAPVSPDPSASVRLFLALWPAADQRQAIAAHASAWRWPEEAQRYAPADWHLTLHFIGATPRTRLHALGEGLAVRAEGFVLDWGTAALWPRGLAVLLPMAVPAGLQTLHARLAERLHALGCRIENRPYQPHLTLARHAAAAQPPRAPPAGWRWPVRSYALVLSTGEPHRRYQLLRRYRLDPPSTALA
jgi:2'-5' RNA ligase